MNSLWLATRSTAWSRCCCCRLLSSSAWPTRVAFGEVGVSLRHPHFRLHRRPSLLAVVCSFWYIGTTVLDGYAPVSMWGCGGAVRFGAKPFWIGLAASRQILLIAVIVTCAANAYP